MARTRRQERERAEQARAQQQQREEVGQESAQRFPQKNAGVEETTAAAEEEVGQESAQRLPQKNAGEEEAPAAEEEEKPSKRQDEEKEEEEEEVNGDGDGDGDEGHLLLTDYEKQREQRIRENSAKLAALNLPTLDSSFRSPTLPRWTQKRSSKRKSKEDDDYMPSNNGSGSDTDDSNNNEDKACPCIQQDANADDDEGRALQQALALSLEAPAGDDIACTSRRVSQARKDKRQVSDKNDKTKKRRKGRQEQQFTSDDIAVIFSLIDEQGKGKFSVADLERVARSHDFTWSKQEISDMIDIFDHNKDGQLDLLEFQGIFGRTGMPLA